MKKIRQVLALGVMAGVMAMTSACATLGNIGDQLSGLVGGFFHQHEFSDEWTKDGDSHWKSCTGDCEEVAEKAAHTFGEGEETKPATEEAEGEMTYTCTVCGYEKTEAIEKLTHTHKFDEKKWTTDKDYHWHPSTCGHNDAVEKLPHVWDEGEEIEAPTETEYGSALYTCTVCGRMEELQVDKLPHTHKFDSKTWENDADSHWHPSTCGHDDAVEKLPHEFDAYGVCGCGYEHKHTLAEDWTYDRTQHWHVASCDHIIELVKTNHSFNEEGFCKCGYEYHPLCDNCGECIVEGCEECETQCAFMYKDSLVHFAPSAVTGAPEGPNGNPNGYTNIKDSVTAEQVILENGAHATKITLTDAVAANSGVSLQNNQSVSEQGLAGWNCGIPQYANVNKVVRLYFTNTGSSKISFRYSAIDYYYDKGAVEVTLEAGESKVVFMNVMYANNTVGLNHQVVFLSETAKDASLTVYGEFYADGLDKGISIGSGADKLSYYVGDKFTSEGLVLRGQSSVIYSSRMNTWDRVYISSNYKTDFDGKVFTAEDIGMKTVTVTFGGYSTTYSIEVIDHNASKCPECGLCTNAVCTYSGCSEKCQGHFDAKSMTVMSFNLGTNGINNEYNKAKLLDKVSTELPDLLGTQEENSLWTAALNSTLAPYGYKNVIMYRDGVVNTTLGNEGAGIWYNSRRFTLNDWGYFWMSDTPDQASIWSQYGALYKRVTAWAELTDKASGKSFVYYNTHIGYESAELWLRSADMIMERAHAHYNEGLPVIITGDFNFAVSDKAAMPAYERFTKSLHNSHSDAITKNYVEGKENTYSNYGENAHTKPIDYILYSDQFVANTYTILREELPEGVTTPDRKYFSSDHFAIKTLFNFSDSWGTHVCWEPCRTCGLCLDADCTLCENKCPGHHTCDTLCPDCGLCLNEDGECTGEHCPGYEVTLDGATFESGKNVMNGCKLSQMIVTNKDKTFEGFIDTNKNYYSLEDLAGMKLTADITFTALYQEDMLAWAQSDGCAYTTSAKAQHKYENGIYMTSITYPKGAAAGTLFAGRGIKDSGSMPLNWYAPANGKNIAIVYIYSHAKNDVEIQYMTENYGAQNEDLFVTLKPGLNRIVLTFATKADHNSFSSCDHRIILVNEAAEDIVLDTYGYIYAEEYVQALTIQSAPEKIVYHVGETFTTEGMEVKTVLKPWGASTYITNYTTDFDGRTFTESDIGKHTVTVSFGERKVTFEIEVVS